MQIHSDNIILFLISFLTLLVIIVSLRLRNFFGYLNLIIFSIYSISLYYGLFFKGNYGSGFLWCFLAVTLTSIHLLILVISLIIKYWRRG
jgi:hypothetical protein